MWVCAIGLGLSAAQADLNTDDEATVARSEQPTSTAQALDQFVHSALAVSPDLAQLVSDEIQAFACGGIDAVSEWHELTGDEATGERAIHGALSTGIHTSYSRATNGRYDEHAVEASADFCARSAALGPLRVGYRRQSKKRARRV